MRNVTMCTIGGAVLLASVLGGCSKEEEAASPAPPAVGLLELPISLRTGDPAPSGAVEVEIGPKELRVAGTKVLDLAGGRLPDEALGGEALPALAAALKAHRGKPVALRLHVLTPQATFVRVLHTLQTAGTGQVSLLVRKGPTTQTGYFALPKVRFVKASERPVAFSGEAARQWDEFVTVWEPVYEACRGAEERVDCDGKPESVAQGGQAELSLFVRDEALKFAVQRFGAPEPEQPEPPEKPEPVVGPDGEEYVPPPPATEAAFTWRFAAATKSDSPISEALRPVCGSRRCGFVLEVEAPTPVMRWVSFLGAAVPDGTPAPELAVLWSER